MNFLLHKKPFGQTMRTRTIGNCCFATVLGAGTKDAFSEFYISRVRVNALLLVFPGKTFIGIDDLRMFILCDPLQGLIILQMHMPVYHIPGTVFIQKF